MSQYTPSFSDETAYDKRILSRHYIQEGSMNSIDYENLLNMFLVSIKKLRILFNRIFNVDVTQT